RGGAEHRIAANADERRLAKAGARQIEAHQSAETATARDHSDPARLEHARHEGGHDADETLTRRDEARGVRPDDASAVPPRGRARGGGLPTPPPSPPGWPRDPSPPTRSRPPPADTPPSLAIGGGKNMTATSPPTFATASAVVAKIGTPTWISPSRLGLTPAT